MGAWLPTQAREAAAKENFAIGLHGHAADRSVGREVHSLKCSEIDREPCHRARDPAESVAHYHVIKTRVEVFHIRQR